MKHRMSRRSALTKLAGSAAVVTAAASLPGRLAAQDSPAPAKLKGNINHSVCKWCYGGIALDPFCKASKEMGITSIDLMNPPEFPTIKKYGLVCAMVSNPTIDGLGGIGKAWNRVEHHDKLVQAYEQRLKEVADAGYPNLICFSGNREGLDDEKGIENCALGLKRIMATAEKLKVNVVMELLNSKRSHKDYQCDHTAWGVALCKTISSERFKLLYDIFHMQIMEGDVCDTIRENHQYIAHYHTGGVPGRNEIDETQEINYPRVMKAIVATGYKGFVAQEFVPRRKDVLASLKQGIEICDV
jgi:hydroxypyruvate isomerase